MSSVPEALSDETVPLLDAPADVADAASITNVVDAAAAEPAPELPVTIIEPTPGWKIVDFRELWKYRELLYFLTWRDVKVRYKQTVLGAAWAILQPLATMVVFTLFFGRLAEMPSGGLPYPLFVFCGLLPWTFFSNAITSAGQSVVGSQNLVTKVYFPRLIIPMGAVGAGLVDFAIAFFMLVGLMFYYGVVPGWQIIFVPIMSLGLAFAALGVGTMLAALTVAYRDFRYVVPFMVQLWMFCTPTIYMHPDLLVNPNWKTALPFNPAYGWIANFRSAAVGAPLDWYSLSVSAGVTAALLIAGCMYFKRVERSFADII